MREPGRQPGSPTAGRCRQRGGREVRAAAGALQPGAGACGGAGRAGAGALRQLAAALCGGSTSQRCICPLLPSSPQVDHIQFLAAPLPLVPGSKITFRETPNTGGWRRAAEQRHSLRGCTPPLRYSMEKQHAASCAACGGAGGRADAHAAPAELGRSAPFTVPRRLHVGPRQRGPAVGVPARSARVHAPSHI